MNTGGLQTFPLHRGNHCYSESVLLPFFPVLHLHCSEVPKQFNLEVKSLCNRLPLGGGILNINFVCVSGAKDSKHIYSCKRVQHVNGSRTTETSLTDEKLCFLVENLDPQMFLLFFETDFQYKSIVTND